MGVIAVFDLATARDLALLETASEFIERCMPRVRMFLCMY